jgi:hypothetical protein
MSSRTAAVAGRPRACSRMRRGCMAACATRHPQGTSICVVTTGSWNPSNSPSQHRTRSQARCCGHYRAPERPWSIAVPAATGGGVSAQPQPSDAPALTRKLLRAIAWERQHGCVDTKVPPRLLSTAPPGCCGGQFRPEGLPKLKVETGQNISDSCRSGLGRASADSPRLPRMPCSGSPAGSRGRPPGRCASCCQGLPATGRSAPPSGASCWRRLRRGCRRRSPKTPSRTPCSAAHSSKCRTARLCSSSRRCRRRRRHSSLGTSRASSRQRSVLLHSHYRCRASSRQPGALSLQVSRRQQQVLRQLRAGPHLS